MITLDQTMLVNIDFLEKHSVRFCFEEVSMISKAKTWDFSFPFHMQIKNGYWYNHGNGNDCTVGRGCEQYCRIKSYEKEIFSENNLRITKYDYLLVISKIGQYL